MVMLALAGAGGAAAQGLDVRLSPEEIYAGDAFTLEVSAGDADLESLDFAFSLPTQATGQTRRTTIVNGRRATALGRGLLPQGTGPCRLERLTARTADGRTLTYDGHPHVTVRALAADPEVTLTLAADPAEAMPGDAVTLTVTCRAPALRAGGRLLSPFLGADLFGRPTPRAPAIRFQPGAFDASPLRPAADATLEGPEPDGDDLVWRVTIPLRAERAGEQTFPAPFLNDTRVRALDADGRPQTVRCAAVGQPLTLRVADPPLEGRPEGYVGAICRAFSADAALDAQNLRLGDPVRLRLTLRADCDPALLRAPRLPELPGFRAVGEPARESAEGGAAFVFTLRPTRVGLLEVPPLQVAWFDRAARAYRTAATVALPVRVRALAQGALLGPDGVALAEPPPALAREDAPAPRPPWPWLALAAGAGALACRWLAALGKRLARAVLAPFRARRPLARALAALDRPGDPAAAAAAVRLWAGSASLTPAELAARLAPSPEAAEAVAAYARLEGAAYSGGGDEPEARVALRRLLPRLRLLAALALLLAPSAGQAADGFVREQAWALSVRAEREADYAEAANLWLRLAREGEPSPATLLNAATCAFLARRPDVSLAVLARRERLYGRTEDGDQALRAACARLGREPPGPWARVAWWRAAGWAAAALGACLALCAVPWRRLRPWRWAALAAALGLGAWALALWQGARGPWPEVVVPSAGEAAP